MEHFECFVKFTVKWSIKEIVVVDNTKKHESIWVQSLFCTFKEAVFHSIFVKDCSKYLYSWYCFYPLSPHYLKA